MDDLNLDKNWLQSSYNNWVADEGVPVHSDFAVDLRTVDVRDWARFDARGAVVNVIGRGDFLDVWLLELPAGGETSPQRQLFEAIVYVISGHGSTVVETPTGAHTFEWGPKSMYALPLNCEYQMFNASGSEVARIAMTTDFPIMVNIFHNSEFLFHGTDFVFPERFGAKDSFEGAGSPETTQRNEINHHFWVTNFVPNLDIFQEMEEHEWRGKSATSIMYALADGILQAHMSQIPVGMYKKAHRHAEGVHIFPVSSHRGYSLLWYEGETDYRRVDWEHGMIYAPPDDMFHQHFNISPEPARYFAISFGSFRYPVLSRKARGFGSQGHTEEQKRAQIQYEDEDPAIRKLFLEELSDAGLDFKLD